MTRSEDDRTETSSEKKGAAICQMRAKREQILRGAEKIFLAIGYERASMSQIAREAGVSKGTLYNHFDGKASLFSAFFEEQSRANMATLDAILHENHPDIREGIAKFVSAIIQLMLNPTSRSLYRIIISEAERFPNLADTFWLYGFGRTLNTLASWLQNKHISEELDIPDHEFAAEQLVSMCQTRIIQRTRFMLPVDRSPKAINDLITKTTDAFIRIYAHHP